MAFLLSDPNNYWLGNRVPYEINNNDFPNPGAGARKEIEDAIKQWNDTGLVQLVPRNGETDYVEFVNHPSECKVDNLGRQGGRQFVRCNVASSTWTAGNVIHEIMHSLGLAHEHQRPGRDNFVTVASSATNDDNYRVRNDRLELTPYDCTSMMHYRKNDKISEKASGCTSLGQRNAPTENDLVAVAWLQGLSTIYAVKRNNDLMWYRHNGFANGQFSWVDSQGRQVGQGWNQFTQLFSNGGGVIYGRTANGDLMWYRHTGVASGIRKEWISFNGAKVGNGWNSFQSIIPAEPGIIYGLRQDGDLLWYRHQDFLGGTFSWATGSGTRVGTGWNIYSRVFAGTGGAIYGIKPDGELRWYRHKGIWTGTSNWEAGNDGRSIGQGNRADYTHVFSGGAGVIYAIASNGDLLWFRHQGYLDGSNNWANNGVGQKVGTGWGNFTHIF